MLQFGTNPRDIPSLISQVERGEIGVPEFQREFIWRPADIADFMRTIARGWPAGSFLVLEGPQDFSYRPIQGAPPLSRDPKILVLDGQQRLTSAYQVFQDQSPEVYYIDIALVREKGEFEDEHLRYAKKQKYYKLYPSTNSEASSGVVRVSTLANDRSFQEWQNFNSETDRIAFAGIRMDYLRGFTNYSMPCVTLPRDTPLSALAKIFETINRTGMRLDAFDLMVAKLYPHDFNLKDQFSKSIDQHPILRLFGVEGIDILRLIALREHLDQDINVKAGERKTIKGMRQSEVLELSPKAIINQWTQAADAYARALSFLQSHCGVMSPRLLPSETLVVPLADALWQNVQVRDGYDDDLRRWFWATAFMQTYSQGANTQAISDAKALRAWAANSGSPPDLVRNFRLDEEIIEDARRRNEMFIRGLACLIIDRSGRDWVTSAPLSQGNSDIELHHIFPQDYLRKRGIEEYDIVGNITPISAATNKALRNEPPIQVVERGNVGRHAIESHGIPYDQFAEGQWNAFLDKRKKIISDWIKDTVKS